MKKVEIDSIYRILKREVAKYTVPVAELIEVQTKDPFKVLLATILSARTKDETTAPAAARLFTKVKKISDLDKVSQKEIEKLIFPVGFYKTKAKHLKLLPKALEQFDGKIPETVDELISLPGVGRKTANLVSAVAFGKNTVTIDTHCHRIPQRLGWFKSKTPLETERKIMSLVPKKYWSLTNRIFVPFGQKICKPVKPHCWECPITNQCKYYRTIYLKTRTSLDTRQALP